MIRAMGRGILFLIAPNYHAKTGGVAAYFGHVGSNGIAKMFIFENKFLEGLLLKLFIKKN